MGIIFPESGAVSLAAWKKRYVKANLFCALALTVTYGTACLLGVFE